MESSVWAKLKWIFKSIIELKRKSYPLTKFGVNLILASLFSLAGSPFAKVVFPSDVIISSIEFSSSQISNSLLLIAGLTFFTGAALIYWELKQVSKKARNTARVLISGLPGAGNDFPNHILSNVEKLNVRENVVLSIPESNDLDHSNQIERYNAELTVDLFKRFILHQGCNKVYFGGLARIPFLVAYGAFLRSVSAKLIYFDKFHRDGTWKILDNEDCNVSFEKYEIINTPNSNGDIGIAVGFSTPVDMEQVPKDLKQHTTILRPLSGEDRNLVQNQENLYRLTEEIRKIIDILSSVHDIKRIHLFLSVQSTLAIDIGRRFQEGTHKKWVIYNFNPSEGGYNWALELSKSGIKSYVSTVNV